MDRILLIICQGCFRVRKYGEWICLTYAGKKEILLEARKRGVAVQKVFDLCPECFKRKCHFKAI